MLVLLALACSAGPVHVWLPPPSATHEVTITPTLDGNPEAPAVIVYADRADDWAADVCLRVWGDGRWTVAEDDRPGFYDRETASGRVNADGRLEGSLDPFFQGARSIWRTEANVWIDGVLVPVRIVRRAAEEGQRRWGDPPPPPLRGTSPASGGGK